MAHKGVREFTGDEVSNLAIGQAGFDLLAAGAGQTPPSGVEYWVAIKAVNADADCHAINHADFPGDHFTTDGTATGGDLTLENGDIVYGAFIDITVASGDYVIAYRGR